MAVEFPTALELQPVGLSPSVYAFDVQSSPVEEESEAVQMLQRQLAQQLQLQTTLEQQLIQQQQYVQRLRHAVQQSKYQQSSLRLPSSPLPPSHHTTLAGNARRTTSPQLVFVPRTMPFQQRVNILTQLLQRSPTLVELQKLASGLGASCYQPTTDIGHQKQTVITKLGGGDFQLGGATQQRADLDGAALQPSVSVYAFELIGADADL